MKSPGVGTGISGDHQVRKIRGVSVVFPQHKKPFSPQLALMSQAISALSTGRSALLESPTGTGKTLALLCSVLSWQEHDHRNGRPATYAAEKKKDSESTVAPHTSGRGDSGGSGSVTTVPAKKKSRRRRVFFMSRTHSQLTQVVKEMKHFPALGAAMTIIGSREQYCINADLQESKNKSEACKELLSSASGCRYFSSHASMKHLMSPRVWDIEDLISKGQERRKCPYYGARAMVPEADLIFGPYNYIIDPVIRGDMDIKLSGAVLVFDEGHNVLDAAMDALSITVSLKQLQDIKKELQKCAGGQKEPLAHTVIHGAISGLITWFIEMTEVLEPSDFDSGANSNNIWSGLEFVGTLGARCKVTSENISDFRANLDRCINLAKEVGMAEVRAQHHAASAADHELLRAPCLSGSALSTLRRLVIIWENVLANAAQASEHFKLGILRRFADKPAAPSAMERFWGRRNRAAGVYEFDLTVWCLSASVAFRDIFASAHSVIITSGTLSPMSSFAAELGHRLPIRLEAPHVIDKKRQLWVGTLGRGPRSVALTSTFSNSGSLAYQDALGDTILAHLPNVPGGVLCFFPSYTLLDKCVKRWRATKLLKKMREWKTVVVEPRGAGHEFDTCMRRFRSAVDLTARRHDRVIAKSQKQNKNCRSGSSVASTKPASASSKAQASNSIGRGGALFLAVCRGKVSEGIDFADRHARAVMVVGIPYPSSKSLDVLLKKKHCQQMHEANPAALSGHSWYSQQAFRALNQAVGRCIRHRDDYGAILLLDSRFRGQSGGPCASLSKWLRGSVHHLQHYQESAEELAEFFESNVTFAAERKQQRMQEQEQDALMRKQRQLVNKKKSATAQSNSVERQNSSDEPNGSKSGCLSQGPAAANPGNKSSAHGASTESYSDKSFQGSSDDDFEDEPFRPQRHRSSELVSSVATSAKQSIPASSDTGSQQCNRKRGPKPQSTCGSDHNMIVTATSSSSARCKVNSIDDWIQRGGQVPGMKHAFPDWQGRISLAWNHRLDWEQMDRMRCKYMAHESDSEACSAPGDFFVGMATTLRDLISQPRDLVHSQVSAAAHSSVPKHFHRQKTSDLALKRKPNASSESSWITIPINSDPIGVFEETLTNSCSPSEPRTKGDEKGEFSRRSRYFSSTTAPESQSSVAESSCCGSTASSATSQGLNCMCKDEKAGLQRSVARVEIAYELCTTPASIRSSKEVGARVNGPFQKNAEDSSKPAKRKVRVVKRRTGSTVGKRQKKRSSKNSTPDRVSKAVARAKTAPPHSATGPAFTTIGDDDSDSDDFMPSQPPLRLRC